MSHNYKLLLKRSQGAPGLIILYMSTIFTERGKEIESLCKDKRSGIKKYRNHCSNLPSLVFWIFLLLSLVSWSTFSCSSHRSTSVLASSCFVSVLVLPSSLVCTVSLLSFFHFILLFWNQVFTWVSFNSSVWASWARLDVSRYFCSVKVFSRTRSCKSVKTVRDFRHLLPLAVFNVGLTRKYTGNWRKIPWLCSIWDKNRNGVKTDPFFPPRNYLPQTHTPFQGKSKLNMHISFAMRVCVCKE